MKTKFVAVLAITATAAQPVMAQTSSTERNWWANTISTNCYSSNVTTCRPRVRSAQGRVGSTRMTIELANNVSGVANIVFNGAIELRRPDGRVAGHATMIGEGDITNRGTSTRPSGSRSLRTGKIP